MTRGEYRIELARDLLGLRAGADVLKAINSLTEIEREDLRGQVDWVEDYEAAE